MEYDYHGIWAALSKTRFFNGKKKSQELETIFSTKPVQSPLSSKRIPRGGMANLVQEVS